MVAFLRVRPFVSVVAWAVLSLPLVVMISVAVLTPIVSACVASPHSLSFRTFFPLSRKNIIYDQHAPLAPCPWADFCSPLNGVLWPPSTAEPSSSFCRYQDISGVLALCRRADKDWEIVGLPQPQKAECISHLWFGNLSAHFHSSVS